MDSDQISFRYYVQSCCHVLYPVVADFEAINTHLVTISYDNYDGIERVLFGTKSIINSRISTCLTRFKVLHVRTTCWLSIYVQFNGSYFWTKSQVSTFVSP